MFFDDKIFGVECVHNVDDNAHMIERFKFERVIIIRLFDFIIKLLVNDLKVFNCVHLVILVQINLYDKKEHK